jgi:hypothetical protein
MKPLMFALSSCLLLGMSANAQDSLHVRCLAQMDNWECAHSALVQETLAFITDECRGLRVVNFRNPAAPVIIGTYEMDGSRNLAIQGNYAYLTVSSDIETNGLHVLDISDVTNPFEVGFCSTPEFAMGVVVRDSFAYVVGWAYCGLRIIDISNPHAPHEISTYFPTGSEFFVIALKDSLAYITDVLNNHAGLRIVNVTNPAFPIEVGYDSTVGSNFGIAIQEHFVYLAGRDGFRILDISNQTSPIQIGQYLTGEFDGVAVNLGVACLVNPWGISCIDVRTPSSPGLVGYFYEHFFGGQNVAIFDSIAIVPFGSYARFYDYSVAINTSVKPHTNSPIQLSLLPAYPNPFNSTTRINFNVPRPALVELRVFDIEGRLVETLASRMFDAGPHSLIYDPQRQASGVYFLQMRSEDFSATQKLILLK